MLFIVSQIASMWAMHTNQHRFRTNCKPKTNIEIKSTGGNEQRKEKLNAKELRFGIIVSVKIEKLFNNLYVTDFIVNITIGTPVVLPKLYGKNSIVYVCDFRIDAPKE